ncbi:MAG TPA: methylated-DNA--[protein]-cysteine S-methyltransferase [Candidatus Limnocylindria bacterium]|nr:methylated-DNA--[protein]-cysteine S-methyltransferase [Candidatus Limnocylindria bacterium]
MSIEYERAFYDSDPAYDGRFVAAVRTTGIYCRPSCRARKPLPKNVSYLPDGLTARVAGYRACLRCHPDAATTVVVRSVDTPIGPMVLGATDTAVVMAEFAERRMYPAQVAGVRRRFGTVVDGASPLLDRAEAQLREYFDGERRQFDLPLDVPGSPFQELVWRELQRIPYGETISYRELARRVGVPAASRAVGRANGSNRLAVIIPCHRVIAAGGGLGGYGGGLDAKRWLLDLERRTVSAQRSSRQATSTPTSSYFHTTSTAAKPAAISQAR